MLPMVENVVEPREVRLKTFSFGWTETAASDLLQSPAGRQPVWLCFRWRRRRSAVAGRAIRDGGVPPWLQVCRSTARLGHAGAGKTHFQGILAISKHLLMKFVIRSRGNFVWVS